MPEQITFYMAYEHCRAMARDKLFTEETKIHCYTWEAHSPGKEERMKLQNLQVRDFSKKQCNYIKFTGRK